MTIIGNILECNRSGNSDVELSNYLAALVGKKQGFDVRLIKGEDVQGLLTHENATVRFLSFQLLVPMGKDGILQAEQFCGAPCFSGVSPVVIEAMLTEEPVIARFPVVFDGSSEAGQKVEIVRAIVFRWNMRESRCVPLCPKTLPPAEVLGGKGALIVFDREFQGASFQLAVSVAIRWGQSPDNLVFTGAVADDESVISVKYEYEKRVACKELGLSMIGPSDAGSLEGVGALCFNKVLDIPFLVHISPKKMANALGSLFNAAKLSYSFNGLCHLMNVEDSAFFYKVEEQLPDEKEEWYKCLLEIQNKISNLIEQVRPRRVHLHLAMRVPSAFALMLGAALQGKKLDKLTIYTYDGGIYAPVVGDLASEMESVSIGFSESKLSERTAEKPSVIAVQVGKPLVQTALLNFAKENKKTAFLIDSGELAGKIPTGNWMGMIKYLNDKVLEMGGEKFDLILNMPVVIAAGLGRQLGYHKNIRIFHSGEHGYIEVCNLIDIRNLTL